MSETAPPPLATTVRKRFPIGLTIAVIISLGILITLGVWQPERVGLSFEPTPNWVALRVPDVAEARRELEAAGVAFDREILDTGVCHMAFFHDPDGNAIMLHRRYAPL